MDEEKEEENSQLLLRLRSFVVVSLSLYVENLYYWLPWILVTASKTALHPNPVLFVEVT